MRMSVAFGLLVGLVTSPAWAGRVDLPLGLALAAADAGTPISAVELVEDSEAGFIDRSAGPALRVARGAYEVAADDGERTALLAVAMSYRVAAEPRGGGGGGLRDFLAEVVGPTLQANVEERRGQGQAVFGSTDPWPEPAGERPGPEARRIALRGVAWAGRLGVCEAVVVRALERVAALGSRSPDASRDARLALRGLGLVRFSPDERCPA